MLIKKYMTENKKALKSFMSRVSWYTAHQSRVLFLFYFSRHKLEFSLNNAQAIKIHEPRTSASDSKSFERGSRATGICKYNASITGSKSKKYIFYLSFLKRYRDIIKDNLSNNFYSNCSYNHGVKTLNNRNNDPAYP